MFCICKLLILQQVTFVMNKSSTNKHDFWNEKDLEKILTLPFTSADHDQIL